MREFKFRLWNGNNMLYSDTGDIIFNNSNYKVMQYTGMKDSLGNDIYEGDILELYQETRWEIVFKRGCFKMSSIEHPISNLYLLGEANLDNIKVIGNIYENSELLGE